MNDLIKLKEGLTENLASNQISNVLDYLILKACEPVVKNTQFFERIIAFCFYKIYKDHRRKLSIIDKKELVNLNYKFLLSSSKEEKFQLLEQIQFERNILSQALDIFLKLELEYKELENRYIRNRINQKATNNIEYKLYKIEIFYRSNRSSLGHTFNTSRYYLSNYYEFKNLIVEKYIRLAYNESKKAAEQTNLNVDETELFKNFVMAISRAIDKYNKKKGVLTSYILQWFKNAKTNPEFDHEYGTSYKVGRTTRRKLKNNIRNKSKSDINLSDLNTESIEDIEDERFSFQELDTELIEKIQNSNYKITKILLELPFYPSKKEIEHFKKHSKI